MAEYTLKVRRFQPESGEGPYWESFDVELDPTLSVLDGLLQAKDREDGSLAVRCSCRAAICGSCGVKINGQSARAQLDSGASSSVVELDLASRLGLTPQSPGVVPGGCSFGLGKHPVESWTGQFESFAIGNERIRNPRLRFADLWKDVTYTQTGSRVPKKLEGLPSMLLGADFLRSHRVLIAHSQRKIYFTYAGGTVFPATPAKPCSER